MVTISPNPKPFYPLATSSKLFLFLLMTHPPIPEITFILVVLPHLHPNLSHLLLTMSPLARREFSAASQSTTLSEGINRALNFAEGSPPPSKSSEHPSDILKRTLSVKSVVSTFSSFAERMNRVRARATGDDEHELRVIGLGSCGSVFELPGTDVAYKKGSDTAAMWKDFRLTNAVHNAVREARDVLQEAFEESTIPRTPRCHEFFLPESAAWWEANLQRFPQDHRKQGAVFVVDRILPLPQQTREALIKLYFDDSEEGQKEAIKDEENRACLVRVYLGERETLKQQSESYDSLRNFPMRLNMIEELGLEKSALAVEMAVGLAIIHWQAQVDGMDTEFVLGSAAEKPLEEPKGYTKDSPPREVHAIDFKRRATHMWMLDFDKATPIKLTHDDVDKKLVPAFLGNDPYFPRPDIDEQLWVEFSSAYLKSSKVILKGKKEKGSVMRLPQRFLDKVVEMVKETEDWDPEEQIVFGD